METISVRQRKMIVDIDAAPEAYYAFLESPRTCCAAGSARARGSLHRRSKINF
jgi:hypothetical protein